MSTCFGNGAGRSWAIPSLRRHPPFAAYTAPLTTARARTPRCWHWLSVAAFDAPCHAWPTLRQFARKPQHLTTIISLRSPCPPWKPLWTRRPRGPDWMPVTPKNGVLIPCRFTRLLLVHTPVPRASPPDRIRFHGLPRKGDRRQRREACRHTPAG